MGKYWTPDEELACRIEAEELARARKRSWPQGSVAGLVLVAGCCFAVGLALYQFAGPRQVVEESVARR